MLQLGVIALPGPPSKPSAQAILRHLRRDRVRRDWKLAAFALVVDRFVGHAVSVTEVGHKSTLSELVSSGNTTLLFTDIEGSTRLLGLLGESTYGDVLALHLLLIRQAIAHHGGEEVGTEGDSLFATFRRAADGVIAAAE